MRSDRLISRRHLADLVLWVDKNWEIYQNDYTPVHSPGEIQSYEYDYIIVVVKKEKISKKIWQELVQIGIVGRFYGGLLPCCDI